ncbi:MAG: hypothetical protein JNM84_18775 [Planctomycetes bacterium]|nr:hypothetical protein [Planctomycetota bacterium]
MFRSRILHPRLPLPGLALPGLALLGLALAGLTAAGLGLGSCTTAEKAELSITREQPEGFPVPEGFEFVEGRSYGYRSGRFESATYVWTGRDELEAVTEFYRRRMPDHGWTALETGEASEPSRLGRQLYFVRDAKRVEVSVESAEVRGQLSKNLNVTMRVLPKTGAAEPSS